MTMNLLSIEKIGLQAVMEHLEKKGYGRIKRSQNKNHDLDAWKSGIKYPIEVKTRSGERISPSMTVSINEYRLFKENPNALLILVCLDKNTQKIKEIQEFRFKDIKKTEISEYRIWFK